MCKILERMVNRLFNMGSGKPKSVVKP
jgi:hypothetical protein